MHTRNTFSVNQAAYCSFVVLRPGRVPTKFAENRALGRWISTQECFCLPVFRISFGSMVPHSFFFDWCSAWSLRNTRKAWQVKWRQRGLQSWKHLSFRLLPIPPGHFLHHLIWHMVPLLLRMHCNRVLKTPDLPAPSLHLPCAVVLTLLGFGWANCTQGARIEQDAKESLRLCQFCRVS